jgi:hypothetical protein
MQAVGVESLSSLANCAEGGKALRCLNANEYLHRFAKQIGLVHSGIGQVQRALIEFIVDGDSGSHEQPSCASI